MVLYSCLAYLERAFDSLFQARTDLPFRWLRVSWLAGLYLVGGALWGKFLNWGSIPIDFHDWAEVWAPRIAFVKDAVMKGVLPLHMPNASDSALRGITDRFLCLPDIMLTPQMLLLRFLDVGCFFLVNVILLYSIGMLGLLWLRRRFSLSLAAFSALFLLFNFNGHILSHLSIGHASWCGYFLLPLFIVLLIKLLDGNHTWKWIASMAFLLFFIYLQGGLHMFVWCLMFLGLLALGAWEHFMTILKSMVLSVLLSMVRITPPILLLGKFDDEFLGGYVSLFDVWDAMVRLVPPEASLSYRSMLSVLGWWELDIYLGMVGALLVICLGIYRWLSSKKEEMFYPQLILPLAVLSVLSIGRVYQMVRLLPVPLFSGERVSSRMLILPLLFLMVIASVELQKIFNRLSSNKCIFQWLWLASLLILAHDLWQHLKLWQVSNAFTAFPLTPRDLSRIVIANHPDSSYFLALWIGGIITLLTALFIGYKLWIEYRHRRKKPESQLSEQHQ